jgi:hypothetical protein
MTTIHDRITVVSDDPERTALNLGVFGLQPRSGTARRGMLLRGPGAGPAVEVVHGRPIEPERAVFYGVDVYSSNAELSADTAEALGWVARRPSVYWASGRPIIESRLRSVDDSLTVFAAQTDPALVIPTRLDEHPEELHSDIVTTVWFIDEADVSDEIAFWTGTMGLSLFEEPGWYDARSMATLFELDEPRRVGGVLFADADGHHLLELLFLEGGGVLRPDGAGADARTGWSSMAFVRDRVTTLPDARRLGAAGDGSTEWESPAGLRFTTRPSGIDAGERRA